MTSTECPTDHVFLLGHGISLQFSYSVLLPLQSIPPNCGEGFEQVLFLIVTPPPHDILHLSQEDHSVQLPSTENK